MALHNTKVLTNPQKLVLLFLYSQSRNGLTADIRAIHLELGWRERWRVERTVESLVQCEPRLMKPSEGDTYELTEIGCILAANIVAHAAA